jgi:hypothetical protein
MQVGVQHAIINHQPEEAERTPEEQGNTMTSIAPEEEYRAEQAGRRAQ